MYPFSVLTILVHDDLIGLSPHSFIHNTLLGSSHEIPATAYTPTFIILLFLQLYGTTPYLNSTKSLSVFSDSINVPNLLPVSHYTLRGCIIHGLKSQALKPDSTTKNGLNLHDVIQLLRACLSIHF